MIAVYQILIALVALVALPFAFLAAALGRLGSFRAFLERLTPLPRSPAGTIWLHAASIGEVESAVPLAQALVGLGRPLLATATSETGRARLRARLPRTRSRLAPLDLPGLVHWSLVRARPAVLVLVETELWPVAIAAATAFGIPVVLVGARISDRSFPRYRLLAPLFTPVIGRIARIGARSELDRERFLALGARAEVVSIVGDLKLDRPAPAEPSRSLLEALGEGPFLVGGSTHPGEEEALLSAWRKLRDERAPRLRLVIAPRHPERVAEIARTVERLGLRAGLRSKGARDTEVAIVDSVGELASLYALATLVFVGGSLAPVGGHNLLEPVQAGHVVVHGPRIENQRVQADLLARLGCLHPVENAAALTRVLAELWSDPERDAPARAAAEELAAHRGATERALALVLQVGSQGA